MKTRTMDILIWVLIYAGLLSVGLGLSVQHGGDGWLGHAVALAGSVAAAVGFALVYVRSRMKDSP